MKLTADRPLIWLQAPGSIEILRKLFPDEIVPPVNESVKRSEFPVNQSLRRGESLFFRNDPQVASFLKAESKIRQQQMQQQKKTGS
jgi:hypothetical protein